MKNDRQDHTRIVLVILISSSFIVFLLFLFILKRPVKSPEPYYSKTGLKEIIIIYKEARTPENVVKVECLKVIPVVYKKVPDLSNLPVKTKKETFINIILPSILIGNFRIKQKRLRILHIRKKLEEGRNLTYSEERFLSDMLKEYKTETIEELLKRLNTVPVSIALAQAAIESGWGSSRFFYKGNNVFGMWTFKKNRKNKLKAKKNNVYLKTYPDILASVEDYLYSINVSWAYEKLRFVRVKSNNPLLLSNYLEKYSTLRKKYVKRVKTVIMENNLEKYDKCKIHPSYIF